MQPGLKLSLFRVEIRRPVLESAVQQGVSAAVMRDGALQPLHPAPDGTHTTLTGSLRGIGLARPVLTPKVTPKPVRAMHWMHESNMKTPPDLAI
jgi:hypothetical protein